MTTTILTLNAGSSSVKFALFHGDAAESSGSRPEEVARGQVENIGGAARLLFARSNEERQARDVEAADHTSALDVILCVTSDLLGGETPRGVGHRITHGGPDFAEPRRLDDATLARLRAFIPWAPLHQPFNLAAVEAARAAFPAARQIGCFDTAFHRGHAFAADAFALPRRYYDKGVRRYGFHGLSYQYVSQALWELAPDIAGGRVVMAHLGNGASMCGIRGGRSVDSTMGFTALDGLPMGTRSGQIDPGVLLYLLDEEGLSPGDLAQLLYRESGLKGLSGVSSDMRAVEAAGTREADQAIDYFVYRIRRELGGLAATLGGLDALVFCGGIGEHSPRVRRRVCEDQDWLGLAIDEAANEANALHIGAGTTPVLVVPTNEERVIADAVAASLASG